MGSMALSVESAEEGAELAEEGAVGGSKSFRFLQILSAANKQYAGVRTPDRQQPTNNTPELALRIGSGPTNNTPELALRIVSSQQTIRRSSHSG